MIFWELLRRSRCFRVDSPVRKEETRKTRLGVILNHRLGEATPLRAGPSVFQTLRAGDVPVSVRDRGGHGLVVVVVRDRPAQVPARGAVRHRRLERREPDRGRGDVRQEFGRLDARVRRGPVRAAGLPRHRRRRPLHLRGRRVRRVRVFQLLSEIRHGDQNVGRSGADELQKVVIARVIGNVHGNRKVKRVDLQTPSRLSEQ